MEIPTTTKEKYFEFDDLFEKGESNSLSQLDPKELITVKTEDNSLKNWIRNFIFNIPIMAGGFFVFTQSALVFLNYFLQSQSSIANPYKQPFFLIGAFVLLFLGLGKPKKSGDWMLYAFFPLMGIIFSIVFYSIPESWLIKNAFAYSMLTLYPLALIAFYYLKYYFVTEEN